MVRICAGDLPAAVGVVKELVGSVAGAVLVATEHKIGDRADYAEPDGCGSWK